MSDLIKRMSIIAGMLEMGEPVKFGQDAALMYEAIEELKKRQWISVDDRLPEHEVTVLCHFNDGSIETFARDFTGIFGVSAMDYVTHWLQIPEAPEGDNAT